MDTHSGLYNTSYSMVKTDTSLISTGDLEIMSTRYDSVVVKENYEVFFLKKERALSIFIS